MPRKSRIDAAGCLHHIIVRGIERGVIFRDQTDYSNFLDRLASILKETGTTCYAWALIPNHFHLLLKRGSVPIARVMGRLLTGHALFYNRRHRRSGHLFQNRYKSILCQEDSYFLELVRYIHLNPLRSGRVTTISELDTFPYCGHGVILGRRENDWQGTEDVLTCFAPDLDAARQSYRDFIEKGIDQGRRHDLTGGGLIRSAGGWIAVASLRGANLFQKSDERILGDDEFVNRVLIEAEEQMERSYRLKAEGLDLENIADRVCEVLTIAKSEIFSPGKGRQRVAARSLFCYWAARELRTTQNRLSQMLNLSPAAVTSCVKRGEQMVRDRGYSLL